MVQGQVVKMIRLIFSRAFILIGAFFIGIFTSSPFYNLIQRFSYQSPGSFFDFSLGGWEIAWVLSWVLWASVLFGIFGKKIDYIFLFFLLLFALWDFSSPTYVPQAIYIILGGVALVGSIIGFGLKLLRLRFWR